jgi:hypothetical protein
VRDRNWKEQVAGADELIAVLSERFGALRVHAMLPVTTFCILCGRGTEYVGAFEVRASLYLYGLCHRCADLPDCIERVESRLRARAAAGVN